MTAEVNKLRGRLGEEQRRVRRLQLGDSGIIHVETKTSSSSSSSSKMESAWTSERERILRNWSEEVEVLATIWREDKLAWDRERQALKQTLQVRRSSRGRGGGEGGWGGVGWRLWIGGDWRGLDESGLS